MKSIERLIEKHNAFFLIIAPAAALILIILFLSVIADIDSGRQEQAVQNVEESLRRAAAACYACEGIYPPDLDYVVDHYGLEIDEKEYMVRYEVFASNIMPEISVQRKEG
ncbi:MAG: hypothetical protein Q4C14_05355 [Bacillota bacterium]|nr:hypothetical protein [Bacillota bacterium]